MSDTPKCIRIEMEYENGEIYRAVGVYAQKIKEHIDATEVMNYIHGFPYLGPKMEKVTPNPNA